jgi:beta-lactam-binding protein with PASTA domain
VHFLATRGVDYLIAVDGVFDSSGAFTLAWGRPTAEARCVVPDVRGLAHPRARAAIQRADFRVGRIVYTRSALVPRGRVMSQSPPAGRRARFLARVNLEVSR